MLLSLSTGAKSHRGLVREYNEDSFLVDEARRLFVVSDGMGGHRRGDLASYLIVSYLKEHFDSEHSLRDTILALHRHVSDEAKREESARDMGATLVLCNFDESLQHLDITWVGDSRLYIFSRQILHRISVDHTYVQSLIDAGEIGAEEAPLHPKRHLLTSAIGIGIAAPAFIGHRKLKVSAGDTILLCSDGLTNELSDQHIRHILAAKETSAQERVEQLIHEANRQGGRDNTTVVLIDVNDAHSNGYDNETAASRVLLDNDFMNPTHKRPSLP